MLAQSPSRLTFFLIFSLLPHLSTSAVDSFVYGGCSQLRFLPGTPYDSNVNSVLTSLVNSASLSNFNSFKISQNGDVMYALFQCLDDLTTSVCRDCVAHSVSQLKAMCPDSTGGAIQLEGCFIKYDNISFLGVEDKSEVSKRCGPTVGYSSDVSSQVEAVLSYLTSESGEYFRVGGSKSVHGVAQCVHDLGPTECHDCLMEASGRLRSECAGSVSGDMFLGKCYVRYSYRGSVSRTDAESDGDDVDKTLAIIIGIIGGIAMIIVLLSYLCRRCRKKGGK